MWGIGIDAGEDDVQTPARWKGTNVLGWALMEARAALRECERVARGQRLVPVSEV